MYGMCVCVCMCACVYAYMYVFLQYVCMYEPNLPEKGKPRCYTSPPLHVCIDLCTCVRNHNSLQKKAGQDQKLQLVLHDDMT